LAVAAFNKLKLPLKIVGAVTMENQLIKMAKKNIKFLGEVKDKKLRELYNTCKALIFPQEEDFGIVPVEAQSCGAPVIAFARGGALETIENNKTGIFFEKQTPLSLIDAIKTFRNLKFDSRYISSWAQKFDEKKFEEGLRKII
jgi:glycosyltransferase involved in cell wall biosynthesis